MKEINYILSEVNNYMAFLERKIKDIDINSKMCDRFRNAYDAYVKDLKARHKSTEEVITKRIKSKSGTNPPRTNKTA